MQHIIEFNESLGRRCAFKVEQRKAKRVTYNAEVIKYYDRREAVRIMVRDLTDEKLFKLLRDIIGGEE